MKKPFQAALAALFAASATAVAIYPAQAQYLGDVNTSVTGDAIYVEDEDVDLRVPGGGSLTINGAVGLPLNPTAQIMPKGSARVQANYYQLWKNDDALADADSKLYGVAGATAISDRVEVSIGYQKQSVSGSGPLSGAIENAFDDSGVTAGIKFLVNSPKNPESVRFAVGAGYSKALYKNTHVYAVASKGIQAGDRLINAHLGLRYDRFKVNGGFAGGEVKSSKVSAFAGAEIPIDRQGNFSLVGEVQTKNANSDLGGRAPFSLALRYRNSSGFSASAGIMRQGVLADIVETDTGLFVQLGKDF